MCIRDRAGAVVSVATFGSLASDVFPDGSVAFAVTLPAGISTVGVIVALPLVSALPLSLIHIWFLRCQELTVRCHTLVKAELELPCRLRQLVCVQKDEAILERCV